MYHRFDVYIIEIKKKEWLCFSPSVFFERQTQICKEKSHGIKNNIIFNISFFLPLFHKKKSFEN